MTRSTLALLLVLFCSAPTLAAADALTVAPDRPGYSDSTTITPQWHVHGEFGVQADFDEGVTVLTAPSAVLRLGLTSWLEARLYAPSLVAVFADETTVGANDLSLGFKGAVEFSETVALSLVLMFGLPTGTDGFSGGDLATSLGANLGIALNDRWSLVVNAVGELVYTSDAAETLTSGFAASLSPGYAITDALSAYIEVFVEFDGDTWRPVAGGGLAYLATQRIQLDLYGDAGLTSEAVDGYVGGGVSFLW